ncbi:MAG: DUF4340 domain-containing protein [Vicinamibacterales bacterium]|nr:DUF4340 domain-containing protein [Vicinamibacterales bacterium]
MRGFRSTFILLIVLAGLLGYIYYYLKPLSPQGTAEQKAKVFSVAADSIEEIQVKASAGDTTTIRRENGSWKVTSPMQVPADETEASGLITNLASLELQRVIDENATDMTQYGLSPARVEVSFKAAGDQDFTRLHLGDTTATGGDMYARKPGENRVFLVSSFVETTFDRTSFDLRDKSILQFERDKADRVDVVSKDGTLAFTKAESQWRIDKPVAARAEQLAVDGLVGRLKTSPMKSIVAPEPTPEQIRTFGFDKPVLTANVAVGSALTTLTVGAQVAGSETFYARDAARPMVFTVEKGLVDDLLKRADDYRPKDVFEFRAFMASRLVVVKDGATMTFVKATDKDGQETWSQGDPGKAVENTKIDAALSAITGLQVASYVDAGTQTGTDTPVLTLAITFGDPKKEDRVVFSRIGPDVFVTRAGEPGAAKVEAAKFDEALAAIDALK